MQSCCYDEANAFDVACGSYNLVCSWEKIHKSAHYLIAVIMPSLQWRLRSIIYIWFV